MIEAKCKGSKYTSLHKKCTCKADALIKVPTEEEIEQAKRRTCPCIGPSCIPIVFILTLLLIVVLLPLGTQERSKVTDNAESQRHLGAIDGTCNIQLVESIPVGLNYSDGSPQFLSTHEAWKTLLDIATESVNIGSFYWTLRGEDVVQHPTANLGEDIFNRILSNADSKRLNISIAQSVSTPNEPNLDTGIFAKYGAANVRSVNFPKLVGGGVLHTKVWIVDGKHFYLGSANMDWRSLTQVKELGVLAQNCSLLAADVNKIFAEYWYLGKDSVTVPATWPNQFSTNYNAKHPAMISFNNTFTMSAYFSSSPPPLTAKGRTGDLDAILDAILSARKYVNIAVMDYYPLLLYTKNMRYWSHIDDALRTAAIDRKVEIKMLISLWPHSKPAEDHFLQSLAALSLALKGVSIEIRRFIVPPDVYQKQIPFSRVNHNKYMVTDQVAYIGTSNWSGDYFTDTAGIGLILKDIPRNATSRTLRTDLLAVFDRDWHSPYAVPLHDTII